jgi:hypothetical protein
MTKGGNRSKNRRGSAEQKTNKSSSNTKITDAQKVKDLKGLLKDYDVQYTRGGNAYLVMKNGLDKEGMPWKDVAISLFAASCICALAAYCLYYDPPTYKDPGNGPYPFMEQQRIFFVGAHMHFVFLVASCLFLPTIFKLRAIMKHRPGFDLRGILIVWNFIASGLSGWAMYYVVPGLVGMVKRWGVDGMLCHNEHCYSQEYIGFCIFVYQTTKCLEWIDTTLLALRKKPLIFLHLFHHIVTMVYCWHAAIYSSPTDCSGIWFCGMNLVVHFIMYGYYGIRALGIKVVNKVLDKSSFMLTILQTVQMVIGVYILYASITGCNSWEKNWHGTLFCAIMYGTYLILFGSLTLKKFKKCSKSSSKKNSKLS